MSLLRVELGKEYKIGLWSGAPFSQLGREEEGFETQVKSTRPILP